MPSSLNEDLLVADQREVRAGRARGGDDRLHAFELCGARRRVTDARRPQQRARAPRSPRRRTRRPARAASATRGSRARTATRARASTRRGGTRARAGSPCRPARTARARSTPARTAGGTASCAGRRSAGRAGAPRPSPEQRRLLPVEPLQERRDGAGAEQRERGEVGAVEPLLQRARQQQQRDADHASRGSATARAAGAAASSAAGPCGAARPASRPTPTARARRETRSPRSSRGTSSGAQVREELAPARERRRRCNSSKPPKSTSAKAIGTR